MQSIQRVVLVPHMASVKQSVPSSVPANHIPRFGMESQLLKSSKALQPVLNVSAKAHGRTACMLFKPRLNTMIRCSAEMKRQQKENEDTAPYTKYCTHHDLLIRGPYGTDTERIKPLRLRRGRPATPSAHLDLTPPLYELSKKPLIPEPSLPRHLEALCNPPSNLSTSSRRARLQFITRS